MTNTRLGSSMATLGTVLVLFACGGGGEGDGSNLPNAGQSSRPVVSALSSNPAPTSACPDGGITVRSGVDRNLNGLLDANEEAALTQYVCNGAAGATGAAGSAGVSTRVAITNEPAGTNCSSGGSRVTAGPDGNGNGVLDDGEVSSMGYLCNGAVGAAGLNSLLAITTEPAGANCPSGGKKVVSWLDVVANGAIDPSETPFTDYVCNGLSVAMIQSITADPAVVRPGQSTTLTVAAADGAGANLTYLWSGSGSFATNSAASTQWTAPATVGSYVVRVQVGNGSSTVSGFASILVSAAPAGPIITSVSPAQARSGQEIVITGAGFGASRSASTVTIGEQSAASITSWSEFQVKAIVPPSAVTGSVVVTVGGARSSPGFVVVPWSSANGVVVSTAAGNTTQPQLVSDGAGGAIVVWMDERNVAGTGSDIFAQRLNGSGLPQWGANGVAVSTAAGSQFQPQVVADGSGGVIVVWLDGRNFATMGSAVFAQRLNGKGEALWEKNGLAISTTDYASQDPPRVALDGSGGAVIAWTDQRHASGVEIFAQRVNGAGIPQWTANGVAVSGRFPTNQIHIRPQVVADATGGAIVAWWNYSSQLGSTFVQRVNGAGIAQWVDGGIAVATGASNHHLVSDDDGGAIIVWEGSGVGIAAQRVSNAGAAQWGPNGVPIGQGEGSQVASDGDGGAIIVWSDARWIATTGRDIFAQRISRAGNLQWTANGRALSTAIGNAFDPQLVADGGGGAIVVWTNDGDVFAQRINGAGTPQWMRDGVPTSSTVGAGATPQLVADGSGGAIAAWTIYSNGNPLTPSRVWLQGLTGDGSR